MKHFYFVADYTSRYYLEVPNIMISAGPSWLNGKWHNWNGLSPERLFIDSGGFSFFKKWGEYPFDLETYLSFIYNLKEQYPLELCAVMDYPCEIEANRTKLKTNKDRIEATVRNAVECIDADPNLPWIPVIQGFSLEEYLHCVDLYEQVGIRLDYIAVGSVCARKGNLHSIRRILTKIRDRTKARLHSFGLSLTYLKDSQIHNAVYSSDSAAWNWGISKHEEKKSAVSKYLKMINALSIKGTQLTL